MVKFRIKTILLCLLFALVLTAVLLSFTNFDNASALDDTVRIYPIDGYIQLDSADFVSSNENYIAVADKTANKVVVIGEKTSVFNISSTIDGVYLSGDILVVKCGSNLQKADLTENTPTLSSLTLPTNAGYISSNGDMLFTHTMGSVTVYSSDLTTYQTYTDSVFAGTPVMAFDSGGVYIFSDEYGQSKYTVFNTSDSSLKKVNSTVSAQNAAAGNLIFVYDKVLSSVLAVNRSTGAVIFDTGLNYKVFAAYGDKLYIAAGANGVLEYKVNTNSTAVEKVKSYSFSGSSLSMLKSPSDVAFYENKTVIADTGNNRLLMLGDVVTKIDCASPKKLAAGGRTLYCASDHAIYALTADGLAAYNFAGETILDVAYAGGVYVLTTRGICTLVGGKLLAFYQLNNGIALASASENYVYALTGSGVEVFSTNGTKADFLSTNYNSEDLENCTDLTVDFLGNRHLSYSDGKIVKRYWQTDCGALGIGPATPLNKETYNISGCDAASPNSITLGSNGFAYFTANESLLGKLDVGAPLKSNYTSAAPPTINDNSSVTICSKGATDAIFFEDLNIADSAVKLDETDNYYAYDAQVAPNMKYGNYKGNNGYLIGGSASTPTAINHEFIAISDASLYLYPESEVALTLQKDTHVTVLNDAANADGGKWYQVEWEGKTYFAQRSSLEIYIQPTIEPNFNEGTPARAKAARAGASVKLYATPDLDSEVLISLSDGTKLVVLETLDGYYFVNAGGVIGYVKADEVQMNGLTTVQIVAIVLSVLVLVSGTVIFLVTYTYKKRSADFE